MKLQARAYKVLWDAHAWTGALASILLFAIFFLGAFALFWEDLQAWQEPSLRVPVALEETRTLSFVQRELDHRATQEAPTRWIDVRLPDDETPWIRMASPAPAGGYDIRWINPETGASLEARSDLGYFLYAMHFFWPVPGGIYVAGLAALALLLVIGSGLAIQLGKLVREIVQFRPHGRQRVLWSDAHKITGVIGLPFLLVMAWTGALMCLHSLGEQAFAHAWFHGDTERAHALEGWFPALSPSGKPAGAPDVRKALQQARRVLPEAQHGRLVVKALGDESAVIDVRGTAHDDLHYNTHVRVARAGDEVLAVRTPGGPTTYARVMEGLYALHFASYGDLSLRVVYAGLALLGAFCILTGNLIWLARRAHKRAVEAPSFLARLTAGGCAGLCFGVAATFMANQLLPEGGAERVGWEHASFYAAWCGGLLYAWLRPPATAARELLWTAALLLAATPCLDALLHQRVPLAPGSAVLGAELALCLLALLMAGAARTLRALTTDRRRGTTQPEPILATGMHLSAGGMDIAPAGRGDQRRGK